MTERGQDLADVDATLQAVQLELYREDIGGALELARAAHDAHPHPRYAAEIAKISSWLGHLRDRTTYIGAQEGQYRRQRWRIDLKFLERQVRVWLGRKTRRMIERRAAKPEFQLVEREIVARRARRVLDGGAGEGAVALALAARHPDVRVEAIDVSPTNVRLARRLDRFPNLAFHVCLLEEVDRLFPPGGFDLVYSLSVLEHVRDVDAALRAMLAVLAPGGRMCIDVPMREYEAVGRLPEFVPGPGFCDHVRIFREPELRARLGNYPEFALARVVAPPKSGKVPPFLRVVAFGSYFITFTKPAA